MSDHMDHLARSVAEGTTRRSAVAGLGALALGALSAVGFSQNAEAKKNKHNCKRCKNKCQDNNKKKGRKNKTNCGNKCHNQCKNN